MPAETPPAPSRRRPVLRVLLAAGQAAAGLVLLAMLFRTLGTDAVRSAVGILTPATVALALGAGLVATAAQAQRWRLVARSRGTPIGFREALGECWASGLVNLLLPGGVTGDAVRVLRRRRRGDSWPGAGGSVLGERLAGTSVLLAAGVVPALAVGGWLAATLGLGALAVGAVAWRSTSSAPARGRAAVWGLSVLAWACYQGLFLLAAVRTAPQETLANLWGTTVLGLAGMSVPVGVGGWGPREGITTLAAMAHGLPAGTGFAISIGYGLLALISALPGAVVLLRWVGPAALQPDRASRTAAGGHPVRDGG